MGAFLLAFLITVLVGVPVGAAAHEGWFVRVCPVKTDANRNHLTFSGGRQGFGWSWIKGRTPHEIDLPRRFRSVAKLTMRGSTTSTSKIQPHAYVCVGFAIISFSAWNSALTKTTKRIGMIPMIVPAKSRHP
jgi:hypothetical protein